MAAADLTAARLRELLHYTPETGVLTRIALQTSDGRRSGRICDLGKPVGSKMPNGYLNAGVLGRKYLVHRLVWLYVTGEWPKNHIDHINGNPADNRWQNLRDVTHEENLQNQRHARSDNQSRLLGVQRRPRSGKPMWSASIRFGRSKAVHLGTFDTPEAAHKAYLEAKRAVHKTCTI